MNLLQAVMPRSRGWSRKSQKINSTFLVPTIIYSLLDHPKIRSEYDLSSLESIIYGAAPMSPSRLRKSIDVFGPVFVQMYPQG
jgi:fatty-acyl-CoA synthase